MSAYERVRRFLDEKIVRIGSILILLSVAASIASSFVQPLSEFLQDNRVYEVLIVALLVDIITRLVDLKGLPPLQLKKNQREATPFLIPHIRQGRPKKAKLFEYSSSTVRDLLEELRDYDWEIQLLIFDPDASPIHPRERGFILAQLQELKDNVFQAYDKVEIKLYSHPASLRGRKLGNLLNVGWYTYFFREDGIPDVIGGGNPMILIDAVSEKEGRDLATMFDEAFTQTWKNSKPYQL